MNGDIHMYMGTSHSKNIPPATKDAVPVLVAILAPV